MDPLLMTIIRDIANLQKKVESYKFAESNIYADSPANAGFHLITQLSEVEILKKKLATKNVEIEYLQKTCEFHEKMLEAFHYKLNDIQVQLANKVDKEDENNSDSDSDRE
jgi:hypothetical protein